MSKLAFRISVICLLGFSFFTIPIFAIPIPETSIYAYISANPVSVQAGESTTVTVGGFIYGRGTYQVNAAIWDSDQYEDRHQSTGAPDQKVGDCQASVTVDGAGSFECTYEVIPSELMKGDMEDEADWIELYTIVSIKGVEDFKTSTILVYCSWCNTGALAPAPQK